MSETTDSKKKNWFLRHKIFSVILALIIIGTIGSAASGSDKKEPAKQSAQTNTSSQTLSKQSQPQTIASQVHVTNSIIKKVPGGSYRYFFAVKNTAAKTFNGSVEIDVWTTDGYYSPYYLDDLAIQSGLQNDRYVEVNGRLDNGYSWTYKVDADGKTANHDSHQKFTTTYEDDSAL